MCHMAYGVSHIQERDLGHCHVNRSAWDQLSNRNIRVHVNTVMKTTETTLLLSNP